MLRKNFFLILTILLIITCVRSEAKDLIRSISDLNDPQYIIGTDESGPLHEATLETFPKAQYRYFSDKMNSYPALLNGKIDAIVLNKTEVDLDLRHGLEGVTMLPGTIGEPVKVAAGISRKSKIKDLKEKFNTFIVKLKADGTFNDMFKRWTEDENTKIPEDIKVPEHSDIHLTVGTTGLVMPFSFYIENELTGFDIELAKRFAEYLNAELEFTVYDFASAFMVGFSDKVDIALSNLYFTPERAESVNFSDTMYTVDIIVVVRDDRYAIDQDHKSLIKNFNGKRIAVVTGAIHNEIVQKTLPSSEILYFESVGDCIGAITSGKADAYAEDALVINDILKNNDKLTVAEGFLKNFDNALIFSKDPRGLELCSEFNEYLKTINSDGTLKKIQDIWFGDDESLKIPPEYESYPDINGTVKIAMSNELPPFEYVKDGKNLGYELDIIIRFCKAKGYKPVLNVGNFKSVIPSVVSGKSDVGIGCITVTPERMGSMKFSDPIHKGGARLLALKSSYEQIKTAEDTSDTSSGFIQGLRKSFERTFIREDRYKLFIEGITNTMIITVLSIIFGTLLGFALYMFCRGGNVIANLLTDFSIWLVKGTPIVVLLMILYYVVFGRIDIEGLWVAVIAFTMTFGSVFCIMLRVGAGAVTHGQTEAAYSLGFSDWETFFSVILPQAAVHFMPTYKVEVTNLIKATSVVGYIAVQDLTKMGDIVRSRTYEAFFPLIAVAVIYFIIAGILNFIINRIQARLTPSKRKPENILHGINLAEGGVEE